jgi:thioredoxin 1
VGSENCPLDFKALPTDIDRRIISTNEYKSGDKNMSSNHVNDQNFESEVLNSSEPVLVDFWAEWCGPCKMMSPLVDELATEMNGKIKVVKLNIEENPGTPTRFGIRGIPTFMIFKNGELVETKVGGMSKAQLSAWVEAATS